MSIFTNKSTLKKIVLVLVCILLFNFMSPNVTQAKSFLAEAGGTLFLPLQDLIVFVADLLLGTLQGFMMGTNEVVIEGKGDTSAWEIGKNVLILGAAVVIGGIAVAATGGAAALVIIGAGGAVTAGVVGAVATALVTVVGTTGVSVWRAVETADAIQGAFDLPVFIYTPEKIFANEVPALDINFIQPAEDVKITTYKDATNNLSGVKTYTENVQEILDKYDSADAKEYSKKLGEYLEQMTEDVTGFVENIDSSNFYNDLKQAVEIGKQCMQKVIGNPDHVDVYNDLKAALNVDYTLNTEENIKTISNALKDVRRGITQAMSWMSESEAQEMSQYSEKIRDEYEYELKENPEEFFRNASEVKSTIQKVANRCIEKLDIDYTNIQGGSDWDILTQEIPELNSTSEETKDGILESSAKVLRGVISGWYNILRYIAIVGLLCVLVYIGIRIIISSTAAEKAKYKNMIKDWLVAMCLLFVLHFIMSFTLVITESITDMVRGMNEGIILNLPEGGKVDGEEVKQWPTNLMGYARFMLQADDPFTAFSFTVIYLALVIFTFSFTITYLKRVVNMAFLTMIAPLVALTYPIDKIRDGKAQAFNLLIKEYIFNALIQPVHFLLYSIFVGSAMSLAIDNPLYAVVVLGFMTQAESFIRRMFGFENAKTVGGFGAAATGAFIANQMSRIGKRRPKPEEEKAPIRTKSDLDPDIKGFEDVLGGGEVTGNVPVFTNPNANQGVINVNGGNMSFQGVQAGSTVTYSRSNSEGIPDTVLGFPVEDSYVSNIPAGVGAINTSSATDVIKPPESTGSMKKRKPRSFGDRMTGALNGVVGYTNRRISKAMDPSKIGKTFRRTAFRGIGLAGGAAIGAALAITDPSKAVQYMSGSMYAGMTGMDIVGNKAAGLTHGMAEAAKSGYYGDEYAQKVNEKLNKQFKNDEANIQYLRAKGMDAEDFMENAAEYYLDAKITDIKKMAKLESLARKKQEEYGGIDEARRHYRAIGQLEKTINANVWGDVAKKEELIQDRFKAYVERGASQQQAINQARADVKDLEDVATS